jgi:adenylate kinase family enzyme
LKPKKTQFAVLIGPTSVGKGFVVKLILRTLGGLIAQGLKVGVISFGQIIRDKLKDDMVFNATYGHTVGKGGLLDNATAIKLFEEAYDNLCKDGEPDLVIIDGFCRSTEQIAWASDSGFLRSSDLVFLLEADMKTCVDRFLHRNAQSDSKRIDAEMETFYKRFHLHTNTIGDLRALLRETARVIDIDANGSIPEFAHPIIMSAIIAEACEIMRNKPRSRHAETVT